MKRLLLTMALGIAMLLGSLTPSLATSGSDSGIGYTACGASWWYGKTGIYYKMSGWSYDSDCSVLSVNVQATTRTDSHYSFAATAKRTSIWWSYPYGIDVQDTSGNFGGYVFSN